MKGKTMPTVEEKKDAKTAISVEDVRHILRQTDWPEHTRRVVQEVSKTAEEYRKANARAMQGCSQFVFM